MPDDRDQIARWTEPTTIEGADLTPERSVPRGARAVRGRNTTPRAIERIWSSWESCQPIPALPPNPPTSRSQFSLINSGSREAWYWTLGPH